MTYSFFAPHNLIIAGLGLFFISVAMPISAEAGDGMANKPVPQAAALTQSSIASGAVEDTLKACIEQNSERCQSRPAPCGRAELCAR